MSLCLCGSHVVSVHFMRWDKRVRNTGSRLGPPLSNSWRRRLEVEAARHHRIFRPTFANQTVRMIVRTSLGGSRVRVELSNMLNAQPVEIGAAHIAIHKGRGAIVEGRIASSLSAAVGLSPYRREPWR